MGEENKDIRKENLEGGCCYSGDDHNDCSWKKAYFDLCNKLRGVEESNSKLLHKNAILNNAKASLMEANRGLQSKVAKQANEIKRLTIDLAVKKDLEKRLDKVRAGYKALFIHHQNLKADYATLGEALDQASKDTKDNFERGRIKGMKEIWDELRAVYSGRTTGENQKIFGYGTTGEIVENLSPTWFINRAEEYHEEEKKIKIGDEVVVISPMGSDDSNYGIVYDINEDPDGSRCYHVIGPCNCVAFGDRAITDGSVRKTGKHYDHIPFDYIV